MERVPGRVHLVAGKRVSGRIALRDQRAVEFFNGDPLGREHRALIGGSVGEDRGSFLAYPGGHATRPGILRRPLEWKEAPATHNRGLDFLVLIPPIQTTMGVKNIGKQFIHCFLPLVILRQRWSWLRYQDHPSD